MTWLVIASQIISILNVLRYESKSNDVQENEDYVEMVHSDMNCISGHPTNMFSLSGVQPLRFHKSQYQMHQMPDTRMQHNQFLLGQHLIHPQTYSVVTPVYFPNSYAYNWEYQYWWKMQYKLTLQLCEILYIHKKIFILCDVIANEKG